MIDLIRTMVRTTGVPLHEAIRMATENPARALGLEEKKGCLAAGADADLVVLSPAFEVVRTFSRGEQIFSSG
jgi:N-acetylglucosamine-6-phosphate deacetylase